MESIGIWKVNQIFGRLRNIWKLAQLSKKTKIRIFNSNVKTVLLYECESWQRGEAEYCESLSTQNKKNFKNLLTNAVTNKNWTLEMTGYSLRKNKNGITRGVLRLTQIRRSSSGRSTNTWRRTTEEEMQKKEKI